MRNKRGKLLGFMLTLALVIGLLPVMSLTAYAAESSTYTITIPDTLTVQNIGWNELEGGITASGDLESGKKLVITASSDNNFNFVKSGDNTAQIPYVFTSRDAGNGKSYSDVQSSSVTSWTFDKLTEAGTSHDVGIVIDDYSSKPAGTYNETVTFTAEIKNDGVPVTSVTITNAPTEALFVNSTGTLTATVLPNDATDKTVTWSSDNPNHVKIDAATGEYTVTGVDGYGSATITATANDGSGVIATCTITGKVTYTSLSAGTVIHVGDTFYTGGSVAFQTQPLMTFNASNGVITLVEATSGSSKCYKFQRGSNGTMPNVTAYKVNDNTDGVYITGGSGTSQNRFTLAVHTKQ